VQQVGLSANLDSTKRPFRLLYRGGRSAEAKLQRSQQRTLIMLLLVFLLAMQSLVVDARTVHLTWDIDWVNVAPDGINRPAVGINGQWPCPQIDINIGDELWIDVHNKLKNETSTIHFHGIFQTGTNQMDGPAMVTQCPIPPGSCE
jgi:iron transport multicopper oxidase